jgi:enoyl-CoA hydratase/carnithine racemase
MLALSMFRTRIEGRVLFATLDAPPLNMIGPEVVHDLVDLVQYVENRDNDVAVVVFDSANPEFFSAHVDMTQVLALARESIGWSPMPSSACCTGASAPSSS